jgi:hypothetical protein
MHDGQSGRRAVRQSGRAALAKPAAHEEGDSLAQRPVCVPGDRHRLRMEICRKIHGSTHAFIIASTHHDALPGSQFIQRKQTYRSHDQVLRFFDGLDLVEPGLARVQEWRPDSEMRARTLVARWGGVERKP